MDNPVVNLALDTIGLNKQALVFVNTKRSAEKAAEDISKKLNLNPESIGLAEKIVTSLSRPTVQCERLATCVRKGIAFHHAGLNSEQRTLVENAFRDGSVKIICCTPTLAAGLDLPAFRAIIRDVRRFSDRGMVNIPVLEYLQMAGRAGRPSYDDWGEAIIITNELERDSIVEKYLEGYPESIHSKLAVEPVLRTSILSLITTRLIKDEKSMYDFFSRTLWAHQFEDMEGLKATLDRMVECLQKWEFIDESFNATQIGRRVAELYLDPWTAHRLIIALKRADESATNSISWIHVICCTLEMRPLLHVRTREYDTVQEKVAEWSHYFLMKEPSMFEPEYDEWLSAVKTTWMLSEWIDERDEQWLLDNFNVRPGELRAKLEKCAWLLYGLVELSKLMNIREPMREILRAKTRLKYGVKEELLTLLKIKHIGRVRARKLFNSGIKTLSAVKKASITQLTGMLGHGTALKVQKSLEKN